MASEMIEYLWHRTIVGRIQGLRRVPFNIKVPRQTTVAGVSWVGEAAPKPLSAFALDTVSLGYYKIAGHRRADGRNREVQHHRRRKRWCATNSPTPSSR